MSSFVKPPILASSSSNLARMSVNEAVSQAVDKVFDQVWGPGKAVMPLAGAAKAQYLAMNSDDWAGALAAAKKEIDRLLVIAKTEGVKKVVNYGYVKP